MYKIYLATEHIKIYAPFLMNRKDKSDGLFTSHKLTKLICSEFFFNVMEHISYMFLFCF
jgi:hypothetical protein